MNTKELEDVDIELDGSELPVHLICLKPSCNPKGVVPFESKALCGSLVIGRDLGIKELTCTSCKEESYPHFLDHVAKGEV